MEGTCLQYVPICKKVEKKGKTPLRQQHAELHRGMRASIHVNRTKQSEKKQKQQQTNQPWHFVAYLCQNVIASQGEVK